jgi:hypothetical protein
MRALAVMVSGLRNTPVPSVTSAAIVPENVLPTITT